MSPRTRNLLTILQPRCFGTSASLVRLHKIDVDAMMSRRYPAVYTCTVRTSIGVYIVYYRN